RVPDARDDRVHLVTGELPSFTGLGTLRDLDLQLGGVDEILRRYAETRRCNLLDRAVARGAVAGGIFAAFPAVAATTEPVHGDCERLVCFGAQRAERHRPRAESPGDASGGFDLVQWNRFALDKIEQTTQRRPLPSFLIGQRAELLERRVAVTTRCVLELRDRHRIPVVMFALHAVLVLAALLEPRVAGFVLERRAVTAQRLLGDQLHADAADARRCAGEMAIDE